MGFPLSNKKGDQFKKTKTDPNKMQHRFGDCSPETTPTCSGILRPDIVSKMPSMFQVVRWEMTYCSHKQDGIIQEKLR
jgi:hypothetical protein